MNTNLIEKITGKEYYIVNRIVNLLLQIMVQLLHMKILFIKMENVISFL